MILKGSQRSGARQLAAHLLNDRDNDHVTLVELRGFASDDLDDALQEAFAVSKATRCKQFLFSLSLNPPKETVASEEELLRAADRAEQALGLEGQPRAVIFHEKNARRHAHVVWSRIDSESLTAINLPHFKRKLTELSRELYLDHGWNLPDGLRRDGGKNPLNFTLEEWQQAKRQGLDPREIIQVFTEAWSRSDNAKAFGQALAERGYFIARGDRRGFIAIDTNGEAYSVARWANVRTKDVRDKLGDLSEFPDVTAVRGHVRSLVTDQLRSFISGIKSRHAEQAKPLQEQREALKQAHQREREELKRKQEARWQAEAKARSERYAKGLKGLWERLSGKRSTITKQNEVEALEAAKRDRLQRDRLVFAQMEDRASLQSKFDALNRQHRQDRRILAREVVQSLRNVSRARELAKAPEQSKSPAMNRDRHRDPSLDL